jgi:DHA1 family tetracycline resistance protein-like MFS transporter
MTATRAARAAARPGRRPKQIPSASPDRPRQGALAVLLLTIFVEMAGFGLIVPFLPFWAERFGASPDLVALLMSTYAICQFASAFFWGWASDRVGRKAIILISLAGSVAAYLWLAEAGALWMLFAARALNGAMGGTLPVAQAYVADITPPERRARGMGLLGATMGCGFIMGPAMGALLAGSDEAAPDFATPFHVAAGVTAAAFLLGLVLLRNPARRAAPAMPGGVRARVRAIGTVLAMPNVALPIAANVLFSFVMSGVESTFVLWTERQFGWGPRSNGYLLAFLGVMMVLAQGVLVGRLSARLGEARVAVLGATAFGIGLATSPLAALLVPEAALPLVIVGAALLAFGLGLGQPALHGLTSRNAPANRQGAVLGAGQSCQSLARIAGPAVAGVLFAEYGRHAPYLVDAALMLVAVGLALRFAPIRVWRRS